MVVSKLFYSIKSQNIINRYISQIITIDQLHKRHKKKYADIYSWHLINFNALIIVTDGKGKHYIDCKDYELEAGAIIPLVKGQIHRFDKTNPITGVVIHLPKVSLLKTLVK